MAKVSIKDFFIQLGFDSTEVDKGFKKIEKQVKSFNSAVVGGAKKQAEVGKKQAKVAEKRLGYFAAERTASVINNRLIKEGLALENKRNAVKSQSLSSMAGAKPFGNDKAESVQLAKSHARRMRQERKLAGAARKTMLADAEKQAREEQSRKSASGLGRAMQFGPSQRDARRLKASEKSDKLGVLRSESAAHVINNRLINEGASLEKKKLTITRSIDRRVTELAHKYGAGEEEIRETARAMGMSEKATKDTVTQVNKLRADLKGLKGAVNLSSNQKQLARLSENMKDVAANAKRVNASISEQARKMSAAQFATKGLSDSVKNLGRSYVSVFAIMAAGGATISLGQNLIAAKATLIAASGSATQSAADFEFLQQTSARLGTSLTEAARGYTKVGAAAKSAGLGTAEARNMFLAAQEVSTAFQLSADDTSGVQRAFSQILS